MDAIRALAARDDDERLGKRRAELASIRRELGELAQVLAEIRRDCDPRLRSYVMKCSPDEPRVPAGNPDGGQWTSEGGGGAPADASDFADDEPDDTSGPGAQYAGMDTGMQSDAPDGAPSNSEPSDDSVPTLAGIVRGYYIRVRSRALRAVP